MLRSRLAMLFMIWLAAPLWADEPEYRSELVFPLHSQHNHAPGIAELPQGDLLVSWYRGSGERKADDVAVYGSIQKRGQSNWSDAFLLVDTPGFPDGNTALHVDDRGRTWLFWPVVLANTWESCLTNYQVASQYDDQGRPVWSQNGVIWLKPEDFSEAGNRGLDAFIQKLDQAPTPEMQAKLAEFRVRLSDKLFQRLGWQTRCKPTVLPSGRILLPLYSDTYSFSLMAISDDQGATWFASKPLMGYGNIQPTVLRRNDGTLVAYMRENGPLNRIRVSESPDEGLSWSEVGAIPLANPGAGVDAVRLANGHWVLVYNDLPDGRNSLAVSLSRDEGRDWALPGAQFPTRHLEQHPTGSYHYPAVIQSKDGRIHAVYSYFVDGGKSMKHAVLNESWIEAGDAKSCQMP